MKDFKKCGISSAMDETDDIVLWNGSEEDGNVSEHEEDEDMTVNMETVRLIGEGR